MVKKLVIFPDGCWERGQLVEELVVDLDGGETESDIGSVEVEPEPKGLVDKLTTGQ